MKILQNLKLFPKNFIKYIYLNKYIKIFEFTLTMGAAYTSFMAGNSGWLYFFHIVFAGFYLIYKCFILNFFFGLCFISIFLLAIKIANNLDVEFKVDYFAEKMAKKVINELEKKDK